MDPLAGWTVAVTADRRAAEQTELLQRRGADVVLAPLVTSTPVPEAAIRGATETLLEAPVDVLVATSGVGLRTWIAMSWTWDLAEPLLQLLHTSRVVARGAKTFGVLAGEDVEVSWRAPSETMAEVLEGLLAEGVAGRRVGVQLHGGDLTWFLDALRRAGAQVVPVPVYRVEPAAGARSAERVALASARGDIDAVTFTSAAAVGALASIDGVVDDLHRFGVTCACTGPVTAAAAEAAELPDIVVATPHRLGTLVRVLSEHLAGRGRTVELAGTALRQQGTRLSVDGVETRLTPRERRLLEVMLANDGAVLSKQRLAATAWDAPVDDHTVEVAVNRLRRKLGPAALALETSARRGYRIAV